MLKVVNTLEANAQCAGYKLATPLTLLDYIEVMRQRGIGTCVNGEVGQLSNLLPCRHHLELQHDNGSDIVIEMLLDNTGS